MERRSANLLATALTALIIGVFALWALPQPVAGAVPGFLPDSPDYAYGALALLTGHYTVAWDGAPHMPRYAPGFAVLLMPAVALGGVAAAVWVSYLAALALAASVAGLAGRLGGTWAAPLAALLVLWGRLPTLLARVVMSDLPSAALIVGLAALLMVARRPQVLILAGALAGGLVWLRLTNGVLLCAGAAALSVRPRYWRAVALYVAGAVPFILGLALYQWRMFGSPLRSGYQAAGATADGSDRLTGLFALHYLWQPPFSAGVTHLPSAHLPNPVAYALVLLGVGGWYFPVVGLVTVLGLWGLVRLARQRGATGAFGRFALATLVLTLAVYLPYFFQEARFLAAPMAFLAVGAAVEVPHRLAWLGRW
ncbi:MAG: hypothetical protein ACTHMP_15090 [Thermomicrobiales bacterium]